MIGTLLGNRYEIVEKIGEGGMAEVYKAKCRLLNRFVAVKILKAEYSRDTEFVNKFKAEAASAGSISHNNIVNIYDVGSENNINYIVMEYVHGKTLKEYIIQHGKLDYNRALDIAIQIGKAIECAHKNNIIHRDIKPQNILVTDEGNVKVTDFGIAKAVNSVTITNTNKVMGSAHYFSPEQAKGSFVDGRTDIYSLGVVIYEMITGRVPYDAETPVAIALKHLQEPVFPPKELSPNLPEGLNNLILKAMEKDPAARYQNIKDMLLDLQRIKNNSSYMIELSNPLSEHTKVMQPVYPYGEENEEEKVSKKSNLKLVLILIPLGILIVALFFAAGWYVMSRKVPAPNTSVTSGEISIPPIVGMKEAEAQKAVEEKGLKFRIGSREKSDQPEGTVISSSPEPNTVVKTGSEVVVYVSSGVSESLVPDVREIDLKAATTMIEDNEFKVGTKKYNFSDTIPENSIIEQTPEANTSADKGTTIDLVISKGPEKVYTKVPNLIGANLKDADNLLKSVSLKFGNKTPIETTDKNLDGKIANQNPEPNTKDVLEQSTVDVTYYVYKEPQKTPVPDFTNITVAEAKTKAKSNGFNLIVTGADSDIVVSQDPVAGTPMVKNSNITLTTKPKANETEETNQPQ